MLGLTNEKSKTNLKRSVLPAPPSVRPALP